MNLDKVRQLALACDCTEAVIDELISHSYDCDEMVRYWSVVGLKHCGPSAQKAVPRLSEMLDDPSPLLWGPVVIALGDIGVAAASASLPIISAMREKTPRGARIRSSASTAFSGLLPPPSNLGQTVATSLIDALDDEDDAVRKQAAYGLALMGHYVDFVADKLVDRLQDPDPEAQYWLSVAVREITPSNPAIVHKLIKSLDLVNIDMLASIVETLGKAGSAAVSALPKLQAMQTDQASFLNECITDAIRQIHPVT